MHPIPRKSPSSAGNRRFLPRPIPCHKPAALAALGGLQGRRKCATFSPRAWRGDERARRVPDGVPPPPPLAIARAQKSRLEGGFLVVLVGYQLK